MGFLDNSSITVDAILTKIGRKRISDGSFRVSKFSLSDEEIDYTLYDVTHPNGTDAYGTAIENMNLLLLASSRYPAGIFRLLLARWREPLSEERSYQSRW